MFFGVNILEVKFVFKGLKVDFYLSIFFVIIFAFTMINSGFGLGSPVHVNHTVVNRDFGVGGFRVSVLSVGDVIGSNEVIVWMELSNGGSESSVWAVGYNTVRARVGDVWRSAYYGSFSELYMTHVCPHYEREEFSHSVRVLHQGDQAGFWVVFRLTKYECESLNGLELEFSTPSGRVKASLGIDGEGRGEGRYIDVVRPGRGEKLPWLGSVAFQVVDVVESLPVNWSIEVDGELLSTGTAHPTNDPCPILVEQSLSPMALPYGRHELVVTATSVDVQETVSLNFTLEQPSGVPLVEKWAVNLSSEIEAVVGPGWEGSQTVWDVDGDGCLEVVFGTRRGHSERLWCFGSRQELEWVYPPIGSDGLSGSPSSKVSLFDVDKDSVYELCFLDESGRLHVLSGDGRLKWYWDNPKGSAMTGPPQAMDVDGDGYIEFFLSDEGGYIHRVSHQGSTVWSSFQSGGARFQPTIADIDGDGEHELLWASTDRYLYCASTVDCYQEWRLDIGETIAYSPVVVADLNQDHEYEALIWTDGPTSSVICISSQGREMWIWTHPRPGANIRMCQALGDVDRDGSLDMAVMTSDNAFLIDIGPLAPRTKWEINFTRLVELGTIPPGAVSWHWSSYQVICDIDNDHTLDIVWKAPFPIVVDGCTGEVKAFYINHNVATDRPTHTGSWWGELDGDGYSEYICELEGHDYQQTQTYCLTMNGGFPAPSPWPEYYHTSYPAEYQREQDWLTLKSAGSNSLWFPITESIPPISSIRLAVLPALAVLARAKKRQKTHARRSHADPHINYSLLDRL